MPMGEGAKWYVVQTQPHAEAKAVAHLWRQGFETYLPRYLKRRHHARRVDMIAAPLFPRYLFVSIEVTTQRWLSIRSTIGVARLLCNGATPTSIGDDVIAMLRREEDSLGFVKLRTRPKFANGDKIRVIDGIFSANLGLFEASTDEERVTVLLDLLGRKVRVALDSDSVAAA
jgi:transcriptional antiterminator RfaH